MATPALSRPSASWLRRMVVALAVPALVVLTCTPTMTATAGVSSYRLIIKNTSRYTLHNIYMSSSDDDEWGSDQLGNRVLRPQQQLTLRVQPDEYDIKVIDEDEDECVLNGISVYSNKTWSLTNRALLSCEGYGN